MIFMLALSSHDNQIEMLSKLMTVFSNEEILKGLYEAGCEVLLNLFGRPYTKEEMIEYASDADAVIVGNDKVPAEVIAHFVKMKIIAKRGIFEVRKIAAMAEAYDIAVAPHAPYGPIALAATLQIDACTQNVFIQEQSLGIHYNQGFDLLDFVKNKEIFQYKDGYVDVPTGNGLGLEIDEEMVEKVSLEGLNWTNPRWRNYDGTLAEW